MRKKYATDEERLVEKRRKNRLWAENNRDKARSATRLWAIANPEKHRQSSRNRRAIKKGAEGSFTIQEWDYLQEEYGKRCAYCNSQSEYLEPDHIIPLARGGSNYISNIVPSCKKCNSGKKDIPLLVYLYNVLHSPKPITFGTPRNNSFRAISRNTTSEKKMLSMKNLDKVKAFIENYWTENHFSPSTTDIAEHMGVTKGYSTTYWLERLEKEGWLEPRKFNVSRSIVPVAIFKGRPVFEKNRR